MKQGRPSNDSLGETFPDEDREHRCKATKRNGKRCKLYAVDGEQFCLTHGTANLRLARANLSRLQNPIVERIADFLLAPAEEKCVLCGHGIVTREWLRAAEMVMDRGGLSAKVLHEHSGEVTINHEMIVEKMTDDELAAVDEIMERVMKRVAEEEGISVGE